MQHSFTIGGNVYEYRDDKFYIKLPYSCEQGGSFGEVALLKRGRRQATVKAELNCEFASFHYTNIKKSLTKIDDDYFTPKIYFLQKMHAFNGLTRKKTLTYYRQLQKLKCKKRAKIFK